VTSRGAIEPPPRRAPARQSRRDAAQPNQQRWESGSAPVPEEKLKKLAKVLETSPEALLGRHPPIEARLYDDSADKSLNYYGEVAIHFCGGGAPLLLSISEDAFGSLHHNLQLNPAFVTVKSLANQTVAIRTKAIADLYFSSEAYDTHVLNTTRTQTIRRCRCPIRATGKSLRPLSMPPA
jgi:transcriptional regulator with XRE-family HTH domain